VGQGLSGVIKNNKPAKIMKMGKRYEGDKITLSLSSEFLEVIVFSQKELG